MTEPPSDRVLAELVARGLLAAGPARPLVGGNLDRRDRAARTSWRAGLPDGRTVRLLAGPGLAALRERHAAFALACPALVPAVIFHQTLAGTDALAEDWFEGAPLATIAAESPARAQAALARVWAGLAATARPSTEAARQTEWQAWTGSVSALELWTATDRQLLRDLVWPRLYPRLARAAPVARWTNGDFTSANILADPAGDARLIDLEFAANTHFGSEDAVRFHALSPDARGAPGMYAAIVPRPGPAWHLFFWLRQLVLESTHNSAEYMARVRAGRLGLIRRLAEKSLGCALPGWSVEAAPVHFTLETACWQQTAATAICLSGWCHLPGAAAGQAVVVHEDDELSGESALAPRPDVQAHFGGAAGALAAGFTLALPVRDPAAPLLVSAVTADGGLYPFAEVPAAALPGRGPWVEAYTRWALLYDPDPIAPVQPAPGPLFSVLVPVYNPPPAFLRACLESVRRQHYPQWELCVVDDGSTGDAVPALLRELARSERRVRLHFRPGNGGIARATNDALAAARGEFVVLLDHDDVLRPHALAEFAARLQREPALDALYSDEDKITADGVRVTSFLKPDFSPEHLLGVMYVGHALCVRTAVARAAGGFDPAFDGVQDFEFFLRVTERTRRIGHVARMLYHWRQSPASSALHADAKGDMDERQAAAVRAHLARRGRTESVVACGHHRVQLHAAAEPSTEAVRPAGGEAPLQALRRAAAASPAEVLVLFNAEPAETGGPWLRDLAGLAARPDSGLVAPVLLARDGRVLESGWTVGVHGAAPLMRGFAAAGDGYNGSLLCNREVAAVSPVCCAVRRDALRAVLADAPADMDWWDLGRRCLAAGLFNRVCATARVQIAGPAGDPVAASAPAGSPDPFFNPHFDARRGDYALARPPGHLSPVLWHLDRQPPDDLPGGCLHLQGWAFMAGGQAVRSIRVRAGGLIIAGVTGLPRPDVQAAWPEAPGPATGFEVRGALPRGRTALTLEAGRPDGTWAPLMTQIVAVHRARWPRWLAGGWSELLFHQVPTRATHPPRAVRPERFPAAATGARRPRFAIVTPSYQHGRFLDETLRSVLDQAGVACDYVVQDGGSTDDSVAVIRRHAARLQGWASEPDRGQADAVRRGFARTRGAPDDLMAWINSDDCYLPGALAFVADYFARRPDVDVLYGNRVLVDEESREVGRWFLPAHDDEVLRLYDFVPQETMFWRRRCWDRAGGVDPAFAFALDWDLLLRFQAAGARIVHVPYFLACFRIHAAQKTAAAMHELGQREISQLRERTLGRRVPPAEVEANPRLRAYLRRSAFLASAAKLGLRLA